MIYFNANSKQLTSAMQYVLVGKSHFPSLNAFNAKDNGHSGSVKRSGYLPG